MARKKKTTTKRPIESYEHRDKQRVNNPPVGLVTPDTDPDAGARKTYAYDPHLDPQLVWAGKAEHTSFELPTVSLHVHERIDPRAIIEAVKRRNGSGGKSQMTLFDTERQEPLRQAVEFYQHAHGWSNRMVAGDSLLVMNSLLEKEGIAGKVQMVYLDPPYGIRYGSNFQPFVNKRDVKDGKDEDLTAEPEQIRAFRDTWELGIHSYLTYLRDRLLLARELLTESGSVFVQISDENVHHVREIMDEVFGLENFCCLIGFRKTTGANSPQARVNVLATTNDFILWYARNLNSIKYRQLYLEKDIRELRGYNRIESPDGKRVRDLDDGERTNPASIAEGWRVFQTENLTSSGHSDSLSAPFTFRGKAYRPAAGNHWKTTQQGLQALTTAGRLTASGNTLNYKRCLDDFPVYPLTHSWQDISVGYGGDPKTYVVQTSSQVVARCLLMTTDPGDLVFDPTCGSGTTAFVAEQWGRRWITCDTSRVALTLAKQRLMTTVFDYYELAHPSEGVGSGFKYKTVPHVTLKSIANNPDIKEGMTSEQIDAAIARHAPQETLYDQPAVDRKKHRVSGPFTVEAVPAPAVKSLEELLEGVPQPADASIARSGETLRQGEWRDELLRAGIRGKAGQHIRFARLEPLPGCRHLHADGETRPNDAGADRVREGGAASEVQRIVVAFGPEHAPLEQRQVAHAIDEAQTLVPRPRLIVFAAFQFDPEAAKDIDETNWPGVTLLKAQMNADLLTDDLKKKRASNESFWLIGQPDVQVERIAKGEDRGKLRVSVHGFDYYNTKTGGIESGGEDKIAVWLLDTDYDGRSLYPRQVFFPMAGEKEGWARLAKNLKAEIDEELIEAYRGTVSLPFAPGGHQRIAVKIVDDRGIESLKVMGVE
jgi:adenine-specific DNA-methyltransferase